jgi:hypothetical protein
MQRRALEAAFELLFLAQDPETGVDVGELWPVDPKEAYRSWQPSKLSPCRTHQPW